jgi:predicted ferric reductase
MSTSSRQTAHATDRPEPAGGYAIALLAGSALAIAALIAAALAFGRSISPLTWYIARASGFALYLTLWVSVVSGLGLTTALIDRRGGRAIIFSLHAYSMQLAYGFLALHMLSLAADPTVRFGLKELLVPFASSAREPWTGFGVLAAELAVVIAASVAVRQTIGQRAWRALHWLTFPLYALALLHGIGAGTDTRAPWASLLYLTTGAVVVLFSLYRLLRAGASGPAPRPPGTRAPNGEAAAVTMRSAHAHSGD